MYKYDINYLFDFIVNKLAFILRTTTGIKTHHDFMLTDGGKVLFDCTCMNLQAIGECIRQIDNLTDGNLLKKFREYPWSDVIGMRHFISHEYMSVDPFIVFKTIKTQLNPLKDNIEKVQTFYNKNKERITDVQLVKQRINGIDKYYLSCKIDGIKQMREEIQNRTVELFLVKNQIKFSKIPESYKLSLCWEIYDMQLSLSQKNNNGRKI